MIKTDNEKEIFLRSFKELENQIQVLPVSETQIQRLKSSAFRDPKDCRKSGTL